MMTGRDFASLAARFGPLSQPRVGSHGDRPLLILGPRPNTNLQSSPAKGHPNFRSCRSPVSELSRFTGASLLLARQSASRISTSLSALPTGLFHVQRTARVQSFCGPVTPAFKRALERQPWKRHPLRRSTPPKRPTALPAQLKGRRQVLAVCIRGPVLRPLTLFLQRLIAAPSR